MSSIPESVREFLREDAGIVAAFGERIHVLKATDETSYPYAIIRTVADPTDYTQDGECARETVVQIDVYSDTLTEAIADSALIRSELSGHRGEMGDHTVGLVTVREGQDQWVGKSRQFKVFNQFTIRWTT